MPSRIIVDGRSFWSQRPPRNKIQTDGKGEPIQPIGYLTPQDTGLVNGPYKIRYRLVDTLVPPDEWTTFPALESLIGCTEKNIKSLVDNGLIQAVMVRGSGIPMFRVVQRLKVLSLLETEQKFTKGKVKRWDK